MNSLERRLSWAIFFLLFYLPSCAERHPPREPSLPLQAKPDTERVFPAEPAIPVPEAKPEAFVLLERAPEVRVLLVEGARSMTLEIRSPYYVASDYGAEPLLRKKGSSRLFLRASGSEVVVSEGGRRVFSSEKVAIVSEGSLPASLDGKLYRGSFVFVNSSGSLSAINVLDIDEYLKGVLASEMGRLGEESFEAYRAQAIAARSYALSKLEERRESAFDLNSTIMDQVYRGVSGENELASLAVEKTRGLVCIFLGKPARTYYCSCCGGHTADIRIVWPLKTPYPYLCGIRDTVAETHGESLCRGSRHFRWKAHWTASSLLSLLRRTLPAELGVSPREVGSILLDVRILGRSRDGRVEGLEFVTDRGSFVVRGDRVRWVMRSDESSNAILRSTLFNIDLSYIGNRLSSIDMLGGGNGHGVGMCQAGAIRMAELGYNGEDIVYHYFPGIRIVELYR